jgi:hypothetical protein
MRRKSFWVAASCILALASLLPVFSSGASPASKEKVIYSFTGGADGGAPLSDLTIDSAGNLYGTASQGGTGTACGSGGCGTVFELKRSQDGWKEQVLYSFTGSDDGIRPEAGLVFDNAGNLYGTTLGGGTGYGGVVFKLTPNSHGGWTESIIYAFTSSGSAGTTPQADLVFDARGNLYGTTSQGASGGRSCNDVGCGAVFELTPQSDGTWTEATLHVFTGVPDGATPISGVVLDSAGSVYGATWMGGTGPCSSHTLLGAQGCGAIYKLTCSGSSWTETILYNFVRGGGFGVYPSGQLFLDSSNHLLGVTQAGGDGVGTVYELQDTRKRGWQQREVHMFHDFPDGVGPVGGLVADTEGNLFGATLNGGASTDASGAVFQAYRSENGWRERILHSFTGSPDGAIPAAGLVFDSHGHLYGTTQYGGTGTACRLGCGTVYEITR